MQHSELNCTNCSLNISRYFPQYHGPYQNLSVFNTPHTNLNTNKQQYFTAKSHKTQTGGGGDGGGGGGEFHAIGTQ
jgi:hypothetical protein